MKIIYFISSVFFIFVFSCFSLSAFAGPAPQDFLVRPWTVGQTVTLQTSIYNNGDLVGVKKTTYSIVGDEMVKGNHFLWMEIETHRPDGSVFIQKYEVREPKAMSFENVLNGTHFLSSDRRKIQQVAIKGSRKKPAANEYELPAGVISRSETGQPIEADEDLSKIFSVKTNQSISVPAGNFKTTEFDQKPPSSNDLTASITPVSLANSQLDSFSSENWGTAQVPIWGVVKKIQKFTDPNNVLLTTETELVSFNETGAVTKIKGSPRLVSKSQQDLIKKMLIEKHPKHFRVENNNE